VRVPCPLPRGDNRPLLGLTAVDSGEFCPSPEDERNGWQAVDGIAYSRRLDSVDALPQDCCCTACGHYDEWYLFTTDPPRLGAIFCENLYTEGAGTGRVYPFVNCCGSGSPTPPTPTRWPCCGSSWTGRGRSRTWPAVTSACQ
jgi:hypothetical protein